MQNKNPTFTHITFLSGHTVTHTDFAPPREVQAVLSSITGDGSFDITEFKVDVRKFDDGLTRFSIYGNGFLLVSCYACFDANEAAEAWTRALTHCQLSSVFPDGVLLPWVGPQACVLSSPPQPFLLVALAPAVLLRWDIIGMLGDMERCLYWQLHSVFKNPQKA